MKTKKKKLGYCACDLGMDSVKAARRKAAKKDDFETITGELI